MCFRGVLFFITANSKSLHFGCPPNSNWTVNSWLPALVKLAVQHPLSFNRLSKKWWPSLPGSRNWCPWTVFYRHEFICEEELIMTIVSYLHCYKRLWWEWRKHHRFFDDSIRAATYVIKQRLALCRSTPSTNFNRCSSLWWFINTQNSTVSVFFYSALQFIWLIDSERPWRGCWRSWL